MLQEVPILERRCTWHLTQAFWNTYCPKCLLQSVWDQLLGVLHAVQIPEWVVQSGRFRACDTCGTHSSQTAALTMSVLATSRAMLYVASALDTWECPPNIAQIPEQVPVPVWGSGKGGIQVLWAQSGPWTNTKSNAQGQMSLTPVV